MGKTGVLIGIAYPEEFVAVPGDRWYNKPLEYLGIVNDGMISAGHAALVLISKESGELEYADFGRYITPKGKGRTRTQLTDPDCEFEVKAEFDENGKIINEEEILLLLEAHPEKTHGAGTMYASYCYDVNYKKAKAFIDDLNLQGSIAYDPFHSNSSNCARFVYDTFKAGMISKINLLKLKLGNRLTPSPLGIVFFGTDQKKVYSILNGDLTEYKGNKLRAIIKHLFLKFNDGMLTKPAVVDLSDTHQWLEGVGDKGWFKLSKPNGKYLFERRRMDGKKVFEEEFYHENPEFDIQKPFKLVHDCNALWCTVEQNNKKFTLYHKEHYQKFNKIN